MRSSFWSAVAILVGTVIGAGIFAIPYAISRVGFFIGGIYILVMAVVVTLTTLAYGEVVSRTKGRHQMTGYVEKYLGRQGKSAITFSLGFGIYSALIAYTIEVGNFLQAVLSPYLGGQPMVYSLIFLALAALAVWKGLRTVASIEKIMVGALILVVGVITAAGLGFVKIENMATSQLTLNNLFLPYGVLLFAFAGATAIPDMFDLLRKRSKKFKQAILAGMAIPFIVYFIFTLVVAGVTGLNTSESAIIGLGDVLGNKILFIGALFGILTMTTSFLALGLALKEVFWYDYHLPHSLAWLLVIIVPLVVFLLKLTTFIQVIATAGAIMGGLEGIILWLTWKKAKKMGDVAPAYTIRVPHFLVYILMAVFALGIIYQLVKFFG